MPNNFDTMSDEELEVIYNQWRKEKENAFGALKNFVENLLNDLNILDATDKELEATEDDREAIDLDNTYNTMVDVIEEDIDMIGASFDAFVKTVGSKEPLRQEQGEDNAE